MFKQRPVTERDFRKEEFKDANIEDYEFRDDGKIVRKDRFQVGIFTIASILGFKDFEVEEVVQKVREMRDLNETNKS